MVKGRFLAMQTVGFLGSEFVAVPIQTSSIKGIFLLEVIVCQLLSAAILL
jgi:hypothetical protein